jgi:hypothetical protein
MHRPSSRSPATPVCGAFVCKARPYFRPVTKGGDRSGARRRRLFRALAGLVLLAVIAEVVLRLCFGFGDMVLMRTDPRYEYIAQPGQERHRFGNRIVYNSLSMRSPEPDSSAIILLGCGDSVINGGMLTDQDSLATTLVSNALTVKLGRPVQFLNISAGSWGAGNCAAYLEHTPLPPAQALVLFVSSHDAHDDMTFGPVVGHNPSFPDKQYPLAIAEVVHRYMLPRLFKRSFSEADLGIHKGSGELDPGFMALKHWADARGIPMVIHLHAERAEIEAGDYNAQGHEIIRFAEANGIHLVKDLDHGVGTHLLRDMIHPNAAGQRHLAGIVLADILAHPEAYGAFIPDAARPVQAATVHR